MKLVKILLTDVITSKSKDKLTLLEMVKSKIQCYCHEMNTDLKNDHLKVVEHTRNSVFKSYKDSQKVFVYAATSVR